MEHKLLKIKDEINKYKTEMETYMQEKMKELSNLVKNNSMDKLNYVLNEELGGEYEVEISHDAIAFDYISSDYHHYEYILFINEYAEIYIQKTLFGEGEYTDVSLKETIDFMDIDDMIGTCGLLEIAIEKAKNNDLLYEL